MNYYEVIHLGGGVGCGVGAVNFRNIFTSPNIFRCLNISDTLHVNVSDGEHNKTLFIEFQAVSRSKL